MAQNEYAKNVFINCPFDSQYKPLLEAIVFAVSDCGLWPRCALELDDASEVRIEKIFKIIAECRYGVHDISRTEVTSASATSQEQSHRLHTINTEKGATQFISRRRNT
jgi:hypothetical protein